MCPDVYYALALSGEPPIPLTKSLFPKGELQPPIPLTQFENVTLHMKGFRDRYLDYWMSTSSLTELGVFLPFAFVPMLANLLPRSSCRCRNCPRCYIRGVDPREIHALS